MAALQTLRDKAAVFITALIALALLAFILTDLLGSGSSLFSDRETAGKIDGETVKFQDLQAKIEAAEEFAKMNSQTGTLSEEEQNQIREQVWQKEIRDITFGKLFDKAGIEVTPKELLDMVTGSHIAPVLRQLFVNQQTGTYDAASAQRFLENKNSDPRARFFWQNIENNLKDNREMGKYMALLRQGTYCNSVQTEVEKNKRENNVDVNFVGIRYTLIPDSTISVSDAEINSRYKKDKELYKTDNTRDIEYVSFPIRPTDEDRNDTHKSVEQMKADFASSEVDAFRFAQMNSDAAVSNLYQTADELPNRIKSFVESAQVGEVFGPYRDGDAFKLTRLVAVASRPDSVKARHILIRDDKNLADSLYAVAKSKKADFAALARQYSQDPGSAINGGDLGWFADGAMVPEFNEACFGGAKGDVVLVTSQFGHHIIDIQDKGVEKKKYNTATIEKTVQYGSRTRQEVYADALAKISKIKDAKSFQAVADTANLIKRIARNIRSSQHSINSIQHGREIVKWAFDAKVGDVSELFQVDDEFVLAVLTKKQEKGYADVADVRSGIERQIRNEKKAEQIRSLVDGKSLAEVAKLYDGKLHVDSVKNLSFAANSVSGAGVEPALVGKMIASEPNNVTSVEGNNGAYVFEVLNRAQQNITDEQIKATYAQQMSTLQYYLSQVVTDVDIDDQRIKFY